MALTPFQRSVLYTLSYTDQFKYPLTAVEVWFRIISRLDNRRKVLTKTPTQAEVRRALTSLKQQRLVIQQGNSYSLASHTEWLGTRSRRFALAQDKWREVHNTVRLLSRIPWIKAIFITGSLAMDNAEEDEDIDFMIVTDSRRLWLSRLLVSLMAWFKGKRRSWHGEEKRSWCFNLWLEETELAVFAQNPSLYTAYELIQARLVFDRQRVGERLLVANAWVSDYLPAAVAVKGKLKSANKTQPVSAALQNSKSWSSRFFDTVNGVAYRFQVWYMKPHQTRERVTYAYAMFHPRDTQGWLYGRWQQALESLL